MNAKENKKRYGARHYFAKTFSLLKTETEARRPVRDECIIATHIPRFNRSLGFLICLCLVGYISALATPLNVSTNKDTPWYPAAPLKQAKPPMPPPFPSLPLRTQAIPIYPSAMPLTNSVGVQWGIREASGVTNYVAGIYTPNQFAWMGGGYVATIGNIHGAHFFFTDHTRSGQALYYSPSSQYMSALISAGYVAPSMGFGANFTSQKASGGIPINKSN